MNLTGRQRCLWCAVWIETTITWDRNGGESRLVFIVLNVAVKMVHIFCHPAVRLLKYFIVQINHIAATGFYLKNLIGLVLHE